MSTTSDDILALRTALAVEGMTCGSCVRAVERALSGVPGVERSVVELAAGRAVVEGAARPEDLLAAVEAAGYGARLLPAEEAQRATGTAEQRHGRCCC